MGIIVGRGARLSRKKPKIAACGAWREKIWLL